MRADIRRPMMRCTKCSRWWSSQPVRSGESPAPGQSCPCGGELRVARAGEEAEGVPYVPHKPDKPGSA